MVLQKDLDAGNALKEEGNKFFKQGDYKQALKCYSHVFANIGMGGDIQLPGIGNVDKTDKKVKGAAAALRVKTFQNIMIIYSKQKNSEKVHEKACKIIELTSDLDPSDPLIKQRTKALYFRANVNRQRKDFELCQKDLSEALSICTDANLQKNIEAAKAQLDLAIQREEEIFNKKMRKQMKKQRKKEKEAAKRKKEEQAKEVVNSPGIGLAEADMEEHVEPDVSQKISQNTEEDEDVEMDVTSTQI